MKIVKLFALAAVLAASPACKKDPKKEPPKTTEPAGGSGSAAADPAGGGSAAEGSGSAAADPAGGGSAAAGSADPAGGGSGSAAAAADASGDWIKVYATHVEPNPKDPIEVNLPVFKITKANFDAKKIEGGTATIEIDLTKLETDNADRTKHLNTPDYVDTGKFGTATVDISNVKKKDDKNFTADAKIKFHGVEKKYPVAFEVLEATDDSIKIKGEHTFKRLDFKVGKAINEKEPKKGDGVAADLTAKLQLTLRKTP